MSLSRSDEPTSGRKRSLESRGEDGAASNPQFTSLNDPSRDLNGANNNANQDPYGEDSDMFDVAKLPNDTMATVLSLQKEFYGGAPRSGRSSASGGERTGVVLQHQIYTVLENRTAVDLELTAMRKENLLRTFRLSTGREDWGIMSTEHYLRVISTFLGDTSTRDSSSTQPTSSTTGGARGDGAVARSGTDTGGSGGGGSMSTTNGGTNRCSVSDGVSSGRTSPAMTAFSSPLGKSTKSTIQGHPSLARDVLERLVRSNTKSYASRKQVSNAMREVLRDRGKDVEAGTGAVDGGGGGGGGGAAAAAAASGRSAMSGGGGGRGKGQEQVADRKTDGHDDQDLKSLKRSEEEVLSVTSTLVRAGFLLPRRDVGREEAYWFSMPQLGKVVTAITRGRKDVLGALKRTRYKEMRRSALESKNPAKTTGLPLSFHVRDLLGLGMVRKLDTPSGMFLRVPSDPS